MERYSSPCCFRVLVRTLRNTLAPDDVTRVILARNRLRYEKRLDDEDEEEEEEEDGGKSAYR